MRLTAWLSLLLCISIVGYLMGYQSPIGYMYAQAQGDNPSGIIDPQTYLGNMVLGILSPSNIIGFIGTALGNPAFAGLLVASATVTAFTLLFSGFAAMYVIPIAIAWFVMGVAVFPISFIFDATLPFEIKVIMTLVFNLLTVLSLMRFVRGSD